MSLANRGGSGDVDGHVEEVWKENEEMVITAFPLGIASCKGEEEEEESKPRRYGRFKSRE